MLNKLMFYYWVSKYQISVMRCMNDDRGKWSACGDELDFDFGHNGDWCSADTPEDAVAEIVKVIQEREKSQ